MKKCPYCAEEIQDEAIVCRYCGRDLDKSPEVTITPLAKPPAKTPKIKTSTSAVVIAVLFLVITVILTVASVIARERGSGGGSVSNAPNVQDAFYMCQVFVERALKSPATASFASWSESEGQKLSGNQFIIGSYVDSENSFGAMIRTRYVCTVTYTGNDEWKLDDLVTE